MKSDITAFRIVEALNQWEEMGVTEISHETGISKSSVFKHLDTLRHLGYVTKSGSSYMLSLRWFQAGQRIRDRQDVFEIGKSEVDHLARRVGETVSLVVEEGGDAVYLYQVRESQQLLSPVEEGGRIPAPISIGGKAILSYRPPEEIRALFKRTNPDKDVDQFLSELRTLRDQRMVIGQGNPQQGALSAGAFEGHRHVVAHNEPYRDLKSVAVPIRNTEDYAIAAIEVSGSESSLDSRRLEEEIASVLVNAGKTIETNHLHASN
ncbi:IclR family transcriptional regulator [Haladaptatus sp. R4]|uniref:IclR family transcriptional regulator n=1 Tax=Haladaptatus sp. R4 TaxID=1679489 RepID=UPI001681BD7F|nr:IclR family transcriptional regulator [Haladaptatus sp. R4]